jgi:hybrid cluster-associated redox disulfide protein
MKITDKTPINHLIEKHPEVIDILMAYGLHCVNCHFSEFDTIENGAMMHGMSKEEIKMMLKDVNKIIKKKDKK